MRAILGGMLGGIIGAALVVAAFWLLASRADGAPRPVPTSTIPAITAAVMPDLPRGYTVWHGLPIPRYFLWQYEVPVRDPFSTNEADPKVCTETVFKHNLDDHTLIRQELASEWERVGLTPTGGSGTRFFFATASGEKVYALWGNPDGPIIRRRTLLIWDCRADYRP